MTLNKTSSVLWEPSTQGFYSERCHHAEIPLKSAKGHFKRVTDLKCTRTSGHSNTKKQNVLCYKNIKRELIWGEDILWDFAMYPYFKV